MSDKIEQYTQARQAGLSHRAALEHAGLSRAVDYAAHVAAGMAKGNAAKAAGYSGDAGLAGRKVADRVEQMKAHASELAGATKWLCPHHYRTEREKLHERLSRESARLRVLEEACLALALSDCPTFSASDRDPGGSCAQGEGSCGVAGADEA